MVAVLGTIEEKVANDCPCAYAHVASLLALFHVVEEPIDTQIASHFLDASQSLLGRYHEKNNFTFTNILYPGFRKNGKNMRCASLNHLNTFRYFQSL